jgi:two-component system, cell cycle response regulator
MSTILIIDDSKVLRRQVLDILEKQALFTTYLDAGSAVEGFKLVLNQPVDVILCDLEMPGMDGLKFIGMLKTREDLCDIPIILLTGHDNLEAKISALEQGASDYVTKPFQSGELLARVKVQLKVKILQDKLKQSNLLLQKLAVTDPLTGLHNRRFLMEALDRELRRSLRSNVPLSLIMADIDHFKKINDTYGHQAGDAVLMTIAAGLSQQLRPYDLVARFGGEEFALVLPETSSELALQIGERLRLGIHEERFAEIGEAVRVSISMGVTTFAGDRGKTVDELIREADQALYRAKRGGRNRVEVAAPEGPAALEEG